MNININFFSEYLTLAINYLLTKELEMRAKYGQGNRVFQLRITTESFLEKVKRIWGDPGNKLFQLRIKNYELRLMSL